MTPRTEGMGPRFRGGDGRGFPPPRSRPFLFFSPLCALCALMVNLSGIFTTKAQRTQRRQAGQFPIRPASSCPSCSSLSNRPQKKTATGKPDAPRGAEPQPFHSLQFCLPVLPLCALCARRASALSLLSSLSSCPDPSYRCSSLFIGGFSPVFSCPHHPFPSILPLSQPKIRAFPRVFRCSLFLHRLIAEHNRSLYIGISRCASYDLIVPHIHLLRS